MFKSLKYLIEKRLGRLIVLDDFSSSSTYFIKVSPNHLQAAVFFLKNDPDTRLTLLDQIFSLPSGTLPWPHESTAAKFEIIYELKSLKLPYRVSLVVEADPLREAVPSIRALFAGARWLEADITSKLNIEFESNERE